MPRPLSLQARSLAAAGIALTAFLGLAFFALDQAFYDAAEGSMRERLQSYVFAYLAGSDTTRGGELLPPEYGPDPRFDRPAGSGLYAGIVGAKIRGAKDQVWRSPSAQGRDLPFGEELPQGAVRFRGPIRTDQGDLFLLSQGVTWNTPGGGELQLTFHVAEDVNGLRRQVEIYRRTLLAWLGGLGVLLLLLLMAVLHWSLAPLRTLTRDLRRVEQGGQQRLTGNYPVEVAGITTGLNAFIDGERHRLTRYRNTLADLAHSLKTPLAVVRNQLESDSDPEQLRWTVLEQVGRMDEIVAYQLSRAATSGHSTFAAPLPVEPYAEEVVRSLEKIYVAKNILCEFDIDAQSRFHGELGDLMEVLGNLLENAFKWAGHRVVLTVREIATRDKARPGLQILVEDDGPGIPEDKIEHILQRGVRGDERVQGHGIGLSIVQDIVKAYRGELLVSRSALGGARFEARFRVN